MPLHISVENQYFLLLWSARRLGIPNDLWMDGSRAVAVLDDEDQVRAVMVVNQYTGSSVEASFVSDGSKSWASRLVVRDLLASLFDIPGVQRAFIRVAEDDAKTQIGALRVGCRFETRMRAAMPNLKDAVFLSLERSAVFPDDQTDEVN